MKKKKKGGEKEKKQKDVQEARAKFLFFLKWPEADT